MDRIEMLVSTDELLGLQALTALERKRQGDREDLAETARTVMRRGLEARLGAAGLPWGPTPELVAEHQRTRGRDGPEVVSNHVADERRTLPAVGGRLRAVSESDRLRLALFGALGVATVVVLVGGYVEKWGWTGFASNDQLWDWLHLLLLPVAFGTVPLWLRYSQHMSRTRKGTLAGLVVAFVGFVIAGYVVPIKWTGFRGNTLWDWLTLVILPVALVTIRAWPASPRDLRSRHLVALSVLGVIWAVTLVGGYTEPWKWTGYPGNTLWDWLQLLLAPLVITTVIVPAAVRWVSGDPARRAHQVEQEHAQASTAQG